MKILVTGGAGFIGSAVVRHILGATSHTVITVDVLSYAGNLDSLASVMHHANHVFIKADITDREAMRTILSTHRPTLIMHLAAESHVDRSIDGPEPFLHTNVMGTYTLLEAAREYWMALPESEKSEFRFHHVSTDEVFGDLEPDHSPFCETTPYAPSSPYSATKAASDHLVRAWHRTFGLPVVITNCSNNYGPYHFPEKLIPHMILNAIHGKPLPVYGDGNQIRDWLYVEDHATALLLSGTKGRLGETYLIGGNNEKRNIDVVNMICDTLEIVAPTQKPPSVSRYADLITYVTDRPGHDTRYAINASKIRDTLGWTPTETFETGLRKTIQWYLDNTTWWQRVLDGRYRLERIGK